MGNKLLNIGYNNFISQEKIVCIIDFDTKPVKKLVDQARTQGKLIDATCGRKTRAVIIASSSHIILSSLQPQTLAQRLEKDGK